jgi:non-homologous end joining protein Ku
VVSAEGERERRAPAQVIDLLDALRKSVGGDKTPPAARRGRRDAKKRA